MQKSNTEKSIWQELCKEITQLNSSQINGEKLELFVLYVDDEPDLLEVVKDELQELGVKILVTTSPKQAVKIIQEKQNKLILIISDFMMTEMNGFEFRSEILKFTNAIPFLFLSAHLDKEMALKGIELKISGFLNKPLDSEELASTISVELRKRVLSIKEDRELLIGFVEDTKSIFEQLESLTLELEENPHNPTLVNTIFGMLHTTKGASGFFEPKTMHYFIHSFEEVLKKIQNNTLSVTPKIISVILKGIDIARTLINEHETQNYLEHDLEKLCKIFADSEINAGNEEDANQVQSLEKEENVKSNKNTTTKDNGIRVELELLDEFLRASGEMTVVRNMLNKAVSTIEKRYGSDKDVGQLSELLDELHKVNALVQTKITEVRKVSLKNVFKPLPRILRDVSSKTKKACDLEFSGDELRVDSSIAEVLNASMTHLIRNSVDHGIETLEERLKKGKPEKGHIAIKVQLKNEQVIVEIRDDGKGIDTDAIRQKLISKGTKTETEVAKMKDAEVNLFIFDSGFSTAAQTTDISGRGVGTSAVKSSVENIGGKIRIETQKDKGSTFILELPVPKSVHIKNCLFVAAGGQEFGIPQEQILHLINFDNNSENNRIVKIEGGLVLKTSAEEVVPLVSLKNILFDLESIQTENQLKIVILKTENGKDYGLIVDEIRDFEDAVVKDLTPVIKKICAYSGATFLSDGTVGILLDVDGIAKLAHLKLENLKEERQDRFVAKTMSALSRDWLLFELDAQGIYAVPRADIYRIEEFDTHNLQQSGDWTVIPYRNQILPIFNLTQLLRRTAVVEKMPATSLLNGSLRLQVLVMEHQKKFFGYQVKNIIDITSSDCDIHDPVVRERGIIGNILLENQTATIINPHELWLGQSAELLESKESAQIKMAS